ncbi:unnamed protein product [Schistocephalus solidus]|uniref:Uncharacterized protein n=1 Tax=Schistocephalus solidus TaxID=70667 RepID=A0A183SJG6_SCHSO|nr:unnamed protein product [Schistocephalus solidus]
MCIVDLSAAAAATPGFCRHIGGLSFEFFTRLGSSLSLAHLFGQCRKAFLLVAPASRERSYMHTLIQDDDDDDYDGDGGSGGGGGGVVFHRRCQSFILILPLLLLLLLFYPHPPALPPHHSLRLLPNALVAYSYDTYWRGGPLS